MLKCNKIHPLLDPMVVIHGGFLVFIKNIRQICSLVNLSFLLLSTQPEYYIGYNWGEVLVARDLELLALYNTG